MVWAEKDTSLPWVSMCFTGICVCRYEPGVSMKALIIFLYGSFFQVIITASLSVLIFLIVAVICNALIIK